MACAARSRSCVRVAASCGVAAGCQPICALTACMLTRCSLYTRNITIASVADFSSGEDFTRASTMFSVGIAWRCHLMHQAVDGESSGLTWAGRIAAAASASRRICARAAPPSCAAGWRTSEDLRAARRSAITCFSRLIAPSPAVLSGYARCARTRHRILSRA